MNKYLVQLLATLMSTIQQHVSNVIFDQHNNWNHEHNTTKQADITYVKE